MTRRWLVRLVALGLAVLTTTLVMVAQRDVGIARDETVYMDAARTYARWWSDLAGGKDGTVSEKAITAHFGGPGATDHNREHPPLMKTLFGFSEKLLHGGLGVDEVTAFRAPSALTFGLLVALVLLMTAAVWGVAEGVVAALLVLALPRMFFHAGLACFDTPIAALWFFTIFAYWKALASRGWCIGLGVAFGLALATKHNAVLLPFAIGAHYAWLWVRALQRGELRPWGVLAAPAGSLSTPGPLARRLRHLPAPLLALGMLGPVVLVLLWPWLWFDTYDHVRAWLGFHMSHVHYNFEYLGDNWNHPRFPWHVALVTTLFTVPVATLVASAVGTGAWIARWRRGDAPDPLRAPGLLLALSAAASMGPFFLGSTPIFGAEKHWAPAMPSLCIAAGVGAVWAARRAAAGLRDLTGWAEARARLVTLATTIVVGGAVVAAAAVETARAQPYALTHYNALAGGAPGGADLGMNRQFWGYAARGVLPFLASQAPGPGEPPRPVYTHDASPSWGIYRKQGLVPPSLPDAGSEYGRGIEKSQLALIVHELHFNRHDYLVWKAYGTVQPVFVLRTDGVPIVTVYRRPDHRP